MLDLTSLVRAGAIIPIGAKAPKDERCGEVVAHAYAHPTLGERQVVRLCVSEVAAGADAEMDALGFERQKVTPRLGQQKFRALGFPGWALVNDPDHASFALEVTRDFKKAKKRVKSKPGHARDAFVAIAEKLGRSVPHFLPSFWEEAGRAFIAEDSETFAAQCFERARLVEKEHKLAIDEDVRSAVYLEFALSGAVAAKSLAGYAKELEKRYGAEAAYARYRELALRRTLGGLPPWSGMGKELRALATAAKLDVAAEERLFLSEALSSPAIKRAPGDFWQLYRPALVALAKESASVRARVRHLFPTPSSGGTNFPEVWLAILEESGAVEALLTQSEEEPDADAAAKWLGALVRYREGDASLRSYLDRFRNRLIEGKAPVDLGVGWGWRIPLTLAEHATSLGIELSEPRERAKLSLDVIDCDPVHVAAHPLWSKLLISSVDEAIGGVAFEAAVLGKPGFTDARRAWLESQLTSLERGTLSSFDEALTTLKKKSTARLFAEFPEHYARLQAVSVAPALGANLRGGVLAEFTWPVWEEATRELGNGPETRVTGFFPFPVLSNNVKAIVLSGQRRVAEHDFVLPPGGKIVSVWWFDGAFLVVLQTKEGARAYWSNDPSNVFEFSSYLYNYADDLNTGVALAQGGFVTGRGTVHAGARSLENESVLSDGNTFWKHEWHEATARLREMDPKGGQLGRASWPDFVIPITQESDGYRINQVRVLPLSEGAETSPLGQRDGLVGYALRNVSHQQWEFVGIDGRRRKSVKRLEALALFPGDSQPRALEAKRFWRAGETRYGSELFDEREQSLGIFGEDTWASRGFAVSVPLSCWHFFTPRDEAGSQALRAVTNELAAKLVVNDETGVQKAVSSVLPAVKNTELAQAVVAIALEAARLQREFEGLVQERSPDRAELADEGVLSDEDLLAALGALTEQTWGSSAWTPEVNAAGRFLAGAEATLGESSQHGWDRWFGGVRSLAVLWALPGTTSAARTTLKRIVSSLRRFGLCDAPSEMRLLFGRAEENSPLLPKQGTLLHATGKSRYLARSQHHYYYGHGAQRPIRILERAPGGAFSPPAGVIIDSDLRPPNRDENAWFDAFLALPEPPELTPGLEQTVIDRTGLTRAESCILLYGLGKLARNESDVLGKELREKLGVKLADAKIAKETFNGVTLDQWVALLDATAPEDPAELLDTAQLATRLADTWATQRGKRVALRDELLVAIERELDPSVKNTDLLTAVLAPNSSPLLQVTVLTDEKLFDWTQPTDCFQATALVEFAEFMAWAFTALPVGDEYRDGLVTLHEHVLGALNHTDFLLPLRGNYVELKGVPDLRKLFDALGGELTAEAETQATNAKRDTGLLIAHFTSNDYSGYLHTAIRTARCQDLEAETVLWQLDQAASGNALACAAYVRGAICKRLIERVRSTPVPTGQFENNPLLSAPDIVKRAQKLHGVSESAAQLYLQLLALPEPTNKNVSLWNGWKAAQIKKVAAELGQKQLLVEGKRERSGREWFLPGAWGKGFGKALPLESWKLPLYKLPRGNFSRTLSPYPAHELFARALDRYESGDVPKLEEV